jgi:hypothetical protein
MTWVVTFFLPELTVLTQTPDGPYIATTVAAINQKSNKKKTKSKAKNKQNSSNQFPQL